MYRPRFLAGALIAGVLAWTLAIGISWQSNRDRINDNRAAQAHDCQELEAVKTVLRADKQRQLGTSLQYLRDHPRGTPAIPLNLIQQGIANTRQTIRELAPLDCDMEGAS